MTVFFYFFTFVPPFLRAFCETLMEMSPSYPKKFTLGGPIA